MKSTIRLAALATLVALSGCSRILPRPARTSASLPQTGAGALADAHVAGIALVVNNVEIGYALLAPGRASDPDVREYAGRMHTDHTSLNATLTDLLARLDLPAEDDPAGIALRDASTARRERLRALTGRAFDATYLDVDLASHRELLDVIDQVLAARVQRRELRDYVAAMRPVVAAHLAHAEQLRVTVAARQR